ncbi:MAG: hypothetical protein MI742_15425 [Desulfobacterales bacterium]|nr:hypothetical protein [Desulfobacterales bacterium]
MRTTRSIFSVVLFISALSVVSTAMATPFRMGVGAGVGDSEARLLVPMEVDTFLIEPSLAFSWDENETSAIENSNFQNSKNDRKTWEIGVGFYKTVVTIEKCRLLSGVEAGYLWSSSDSDQKMLTNNRTNHYTYNQDNDGYYLIPSLILDYPISDHLILGGRIGMAYSRLEGKQKTRSISIKDSQVTSSSTETTDIKRTQWKLQTLLTLNYLF